MAQSGSLLDSVSCPICLDLLKDPVTTPCGHSYCMKCINQHWDQENLRHSCPECRESFSPRPVLGKNIMLSDLVEQLKKTGLTAPPLDHSYSRNQNPDSTTRRRSQLFLSLQHRETMLERLRQEAQDISSSAQTTVQHSEASFREMALLLDKRRSEVERKIRSEEQTQLERIQQLQDQLQCEVTELKKHISELDALPIPPDQGQSQQLCPSLFTDTQPEPALTSAESQGFFRTMTRAVSMLRNKLQLILTEDPINISPTVSPPCVPKSPAVPCTREDFLQYSTQISLDPNTVHPLLSLSDGNRRVTVRGQAYPDHPDRFSVFRQALNSEGLTGRCYWEVEWSGKWIRIAVSYSHIRRKGDSDECLFGCNDKSWALHCDRNGYSFRFNSIRSEVVGPVSSRIGVFLDHSAGVLTFYSVSQTMTFLHSVKAKFTQPLFTGVGLGWCNSGDTACFPKLK